MIKAVRSLQEWRSTPDGPQIARKYLQENDTDKNEDIPGGLWEELRLLSSEGGVPLEQPAAASGTPAIVGPSSCSGASQGRYETPSRKERPGEAPSESSRSVRSAEKAADSRLDVKREIKSESDLSVAAKRPKRYWATQ